MMAANDGRGEGAITQGALPGLLRGLYVGRRTGLLHMANGADRCSVCLINGHIAWGQSSIEECRLGPVLVRHGFLTQAALDLIFDQVGGGRRLGDLLVELGSLDRETLDQALALQVRETLLAAFSWPQGTWSFEEQDPERFKGYDKALGVSTGDLILDACWSVTDPDVVRYALGDLDRTLALTTDPLLRFQRLTMTPVDGLLLGLVDGIRSAREVLGLLPERGEEPQRSLFGLLSTGMLEFVEPQEEPRALSDDPLTRAELLRVHAGLLERDHFQILGLLRSASAGEVKAAWERLARRFHPDAHHDAALSDLRAQLETVFARLAEAAKVLGNVQWRAAYEKSLSAAAAAQPAEPAAEFASAEELVAQAELELAEGRHWDVLHAVEGLLPNLTGRLRLRALMLRARIYAREAKWHREAENQLKAVVAEDPANVEAFFLLGQLYKAESLQARAAAMFRKVLELRPRHAGALAELGSGPRQG